MAFEPGYNAAVLLDEFDLSGDLTQYTFTKGIDMADTTTFGNASRVFLPTLRNSQLDVQGVWNPAVDASDEELIVADDGLAHVVSVSAEGFQAIGDKAVLVNGLLDNYQPRATMTDAVRFSAGLTHTATGNLGVTLHHNNQETTTGNFASVDHGSGPTTDGGTGHLHITQFSGTNATVTIEDSTDDAVFGSLVAFTAATGVGSERVTVAGNVERYVRINLAGTFTSITFVVSFARHLP